MAYVFNEEDKVKWSELSPSLQNRFKELEMMKSSLSTVSIGRIETTRINISRVAPAKPSNNSDLWIDEKYRIGRAFTENNWEFTRAAWATSGFIPSNPQISTDIPPDPTVIDRPVVTETFNFMTHIDNPVTGQVSRSYGPKVNSLRLTFDPITERNQIALYGKDIKIHITTSCSDTTYTGNHVGNILYIVDAKQYHYQKLLCNQSIDLNFFIGSPSHNSVQFLPEIETACFSLRDPGAIIVPTDSIKTQNLFQYGKVEGYPYYFLLGKYIKATGLLENDYTESLLKTDVERNGLGMGDPPFIKTGSSNLTVKIDITYTHYI